VTPTSDKFKQIGWDVFKISAENVGLQTCINRFRPTCYLILIDQVGYMTHIRINNGTKFRLLWLILHQPPPFKYRYRVFVFLLNFKLILTTTHTCKQRPTPPYQQILDPSLKLAKCPKLHELTLKFTRCFCQKLRLFAERNLIKPSMFLLETNRFEEQLEKMCCAVVSKCRPTPFTRLNSNFNPNLSISQSVHT